MNRRTISRILLFLAAIAVVMALLPHKRGHLYSYEINRPWGHSLLTAAFDVPVFRDSVSSREIRDSLEASFIPVFKRVPEGGRELLYRMLSMEGVSPNQRNRLRNAVERAYSNGIVNPDDYDEIRKRQLKEVRYVVNNSVVKESAGRLKSPREVYARLDSMFSEPEVRNAMGEMKFSTLLVPNIILDTATTRRLYDEHMQPAEAAIGVIQKGERIIDRGDRVTPQLYEILNTYEQMIRSRDFTANRGDFYFILGQILFAVFLFGAVYIFLYLFRHEYFHDVKKLTAIMIAMVGMYVIATIISRSIGYGVYVVPFAIIPIMFLVFFDSRTALFCHIIEVVLCSTLAPATFEFVFLQILTGMTSIFSLRELTRRSQLLRTAGLVFFVYASGYVAVELMLSGTLSSNAGRLIGYFAINALLISFAYILIFVFEKMFGLTSMVSLVELSDINNHLLRELSEECPGTFQHSMSVSNLASDAARKINANVLIVRAGALYHDIGKIANPAFFTENQHGVNPHDALDPVRSSKIIIGHITEGLKLAEREKLPKVLRDMIAQHHGKGVAKYFYSTYCSAHPDETVDPAPFTYPGPNPQSREASLLMMADSVEAASRSLSEHTPEAISNLVNRIIDGQVSAGLHSESPLSFRDIKIIKEAFINRLRTIYHVRVSYPKETTPPTQ